MRKQSAIHVAIAICTLFLFTLLGIMESSAWARAGGGGSMGSRGSRSFSAPRMPSGPSSPSPFSSPSRPDSGFRSPSTPGSQGGFSRSPFAQGLAGGLAGGFLGSLLFGGRGYAAAPGGMGGGGVGLLDLIILGLIAYFVWKFFKRRQAYNSASSSYYSDDAPSRVEGHGVPQESSPYYGGMQEPVPAYDEVQRGLDQIRRYDPGFNEEAFKETAQDLFFRIQAAWMNRSLDGVENIVTPEMAEYFRNQFEMMKQKGRINKLENIAVRKVEPSEAWQEAGKDYITVLFTANLLDYTVNDVTGQVVEGDRLNPVKFQEFWTYSRDVGSSRWQLSAINQVGH